MHVAMRRETGILGPTRRLGDQQTKRPREREAGKLGDQQTGRRAGWRMGTSKPVHKDQQTSGQGREPADQVTKRLGDKGQQTGSLGDPRVVEDWTTKRQAMMFRRKSE